MRHLLVIAVVALVLRFGASAQESDGGKAPGNVQTCDTIYVGPPGGSLHNPLNWEPFLPKASSVACFPDDEADRGMIHEVPMSAPPTRPISPVRIRRLTPGSSVGQGLGNQHSLIPGPRGSTVYSNEIDLVAAMHAPGAGDRMADDLKFAVADCQVLSYNLGVFGAGASGSPTFDVHAALWDGDPCLPASSLIPNSAASFLGLPNDGHTAYFLQVALSQPTSVPVTVWLAATFSTDDSGWIVAERAETGFTADFWSEDDSALGCTLWSFSDDTYAGFWANVDANVGGMPQGACCVGSTCIVTDAFDCRELDGYFLEGVGPCTEYVCATGACCKQDAECVDDDGGGGLMDEELCDIIGGNYLGGTECGASDPCQRFRIPQGFEIIEVAPGMETLQRLHPRLNNCGGIVFSAGINPLGPWTEIYLYDNGLLARLTDNDVCDVYPDINDKGTVAWIREYDGFGGGEIVMLQDGEFTVLADGIAPSINNLGHMAWDRFSPEPPAYRAKIFFYDGSTVKQIFDDGLSNQSPRINDRDEMIWTRHDFTGGGGFDDWTSDIMFYSDGVITALPAASSFPHGPTPQIPTLNNLGQAVWDGSLGVEYWDGVNDPILLVPDANGPADINDRGDIAYWGLGAPPLENTVQVWLLRDGVHYPISADPEAKNHSPDLNEATEIAWKWKDYDPPVTTGTRFMRRIRNGDVDFDGDRDLDDFIPLPNCWTGPVPTDRLCECRFFDIDHDRDIDYDDFDLFMRVYTGPLEDCNQNEIIDLYDLIDGPSTDCNLNGIPDECDIESGFSQDINGDGVPDECIAPIPAVSEWGLVALTLLLLLAGSIVLTRRRPVSRPS